MGKPTFTAKKNGKRGSKPSHMIGSINKNDSTSKSKPTSQSTAFLNPLGHRYISRLNFSDWYDEYTSESSVFPKTNFSRTEYTIMEHQQFVAARIIQKYFRCWYHRSRYEKMRHAAIIIQANWRSFSFQRRFYKQLELLLQYRIQSCFNKSATKIQALWRGYWVRQSIHDHHSLFTTQVSLAEDLLQCVAFKLHYMMRTFQIPGLYSVRNSHCLSRVEKLLATMSFKHYSDQARHERWHRDQNICRGRRQFQKSERHTKIPYTGPNTKELCNLPNLPKGKELDRRLFKILALYQRATDDTAKAKKLKHSHLEEQREEEDEPQEAISSGKKTKRPCAFCADIVSSMQRWNILNGTNLTIDSDLFKQPGRLEKLLRDINNIYNSLEKQCHCRSETVVELKCAVGEGSEPKNSFSDNIVPQNSIKSEANSTI